MTNPGQLAALVANNRLDADIADLLNELQGFTFLTWAGQTADFALHELNNNNLVGIVRQANIQKLKDQLDPKHHAIVDYPFKAALVLYKTGILHLYFIFIHAVL